MVSACGKPSAQRSQSHLEKNAEQPIAARMEPSGTRSCMSPVASPLAAAARVQVEGPSLPEAVAAKVTFNLPTPGSRAAEAAFRRKRSIPLTSGR
jgi:hypothetical protein